MSCKEAAPVIIPVTLKNFEMCEKFIKTIILYHAESIWCKGSLGHFRKTTQEKLRNGIIFFFFLRKDILVQDIYDKAEPLIKSTCWGDSWKNRISVEIPEEMSHRNVYTHPLTHTHNFLYRPKKKKKKETVREIATET